MNIDEFLKTNKPVVKDIKYKISKIKEKEDGVIVYLDNKDKICISVDNYFKYGLSSLEGLDDNLYEILKNEERIYLAYRGALRKLSAKDYTVKQIKDYLKLKKELNDEEINTIINKLIEYKLLDDDRYCINRYTYLDKQLMSLKQIKFKLQKEGVHKEIIEKYVINNDDDYDKAKTLALKYSNIIKNKSLNNTKQSILGKLINAGYSYDAAKNALDSLNLSNDNEMQLLNKEYLKAKNKYEKKYEDYELKNHIYSYLINKGFKTEDVKNVMEG